MKVFYSVFDLTPIKRANRLSSLDKKSGVYLKAVLGDNTLFAEYFPHLPLGDRTYGQFLDEFKFQNVEYDQKVFDLLLKDAEFQKVKPKKFMNHQLWTGSEEIEASVLKYKMLHPQDRAFLEPLKKGLKLRIDFNALFTRAEYLKFLEGIPPELLKNIEYTEDPLSEKDWSDLTIPSAMDFIEGNPYQYYIYKPNCEFYPKKENIKVVYSSYLGADLGRWHSYAEMVSKDHVHSTQGIVSKDFYQEERFFYDGNYRDGFIANLDSVKKVYQDVAAGEWKSLCSM